MTLTFTLKGLPPSKNHSHRNVVNKRTGRHMRVTTNETRDWMDMARTIAAVEVNRTGWVCAEDDVCVDLVVYFPDRRKRDAQNYEMVTFDALQGVVYKDDLLVCEHTTRRAYDKADPRVEVTVRRKAGP